ncbi:MAG: uracil-DNA glycosylase, partial [Alphaproteobacteria bacterium]|nr:uracil-DNA glycosylase [Alphaproteobacteria bacterium]
MARSLSPREVLRWYLDAGVDEAVGAEPLDRYALSARIVSPPPVLPRPVPPRPSPPRQAPPSADSPLRAAEGASALAASAPTVAELRRALENFDGCGLRATATTTVFADGNPEARVMVIGEAPGAEEDRQGLPFVGVSGHLLDRMLASIGLDRSNTYIANVVPWRPPGNRKPTPAEVAVCAPFLERHIALVDPEVLLLLGSLAAATVLARGDGVMRLRGRWFDYATALPRPIPAIATFHPARVLSGGERNRLLLAKL